MKRVQIARNVCLGFLIAFTGCGVPSSTVSRDQTESRGSETELSNFIGRKDVEQIIIDENLSRWLNATRSDSGYLHANLDEKWAKVEPFHATGVSQGRLLFVLATGFELTDDIEYLQACDRGAEFLLRGFGPTKANGGWCIKVSEDGTRLDCRRNTYDNAFIILGLSAAYRVTGNDQYLDAARDCWRVIRERHADHLGGFHWKLSQDFKPTHSGNQNPIMHLFESLLALHDATGEAADLEAAQEVGGFVLMKLFQHEQSCIPEFYDRDWSPLRNGGYVDLGHQFEWAFLLSQAAEQGCGEVYLDRGESILDFAMRTGYDEERGGTFTNADFDGNVTNGGKGAWQQAECLRAMVHYASQRGHYELWPQIEQTWDLVEQDFVDHQYGGWVASSKNRRKGSNWKCGYHEIGMYREILRQFDRYETSETRSGSTSSLSLKGNESR